MDEAAIEAAGLAPLQPLLALATEDALAAPAGRLAAAAALHSRQVWCIPVFSLVCSRRAR